MIVKGPGIAPGTRAEGNVYLLDTLATLCDLAGIRAPESNEGLSFKPILMGQKETLRDVLYGVYNGGTKPGLRCVKKGPWKLVEWDVLDGKVRKTQLFNLDENPLEFLDEHHRPDIHRLTGTQALPHQINLAEDPNYQDKLAEMRELLLSEMKRLDDPWRLWNQPQDVQTP
jgi:arylsulfatase A-like enzyme